MPAFDELRDASPASLRKLNDMLRFLFKKVQGGISHEELTPELAEDIATVDADKLMDNCITGDKIGDGEINGSHIEEASIGTAHIQNAAITNGKIESLSADKLTAGTIDAADITVKNLNAEEITVGKITGQQIMYETITSSHIQEVSADKIQGGILTLGGRVNENTYDGEIRILDFLGNCIGEIGKGGAKFFGESLMTSIMTKPDEIGNEYAMIGGNGIDFIGVYEGQKPGPDIPGDPLIDTVSIVARAGNLDTSIGFEYNTTNIASPPDYIYFHNQPGDSIAVDSSQPVNFVNGLKTGKVDLNGDVPLLVDRQNISTNVAVREQVIKTGWGYVTGPSPAANGAGKTVSFDDAFDDIPIVYISSCGARTLGAPTNIGNFNTSGAVFAETRNITQTGFMAQLYSRDAGTNLTAGAYYGYSWIAIGTKSRQ